MIEKIKSFLIFLFIILVIVGITSVIVVLVFYDTNMFKSPVVMTTKGRVKGIEKQYKYFPEKTYYAFQGIPYAMPPIGTLRFKEPQPIKEWGIVLNATKERSVCPQKAIPGRNDSRVIGSEDCLYLNVYTPENPEEINDKSLKPVMVWVHGGGFQSGSGNTDYYGPDFLVKNDVVLVTFNYRLGVLGFLNLNVEDAPGNPGLKDQVAVLHWVKENIANFGGDPGNVTLFGEDAGAVSIQLLTITPSINKSGLFHKVILQSGSVMNPWAYNDDPEQNALDLCDYLKIKKQMYGEIIEELLKIPAEDLIMAQDEIVTQEDFEKLQIFAFVPSFEEGIDEKPEKSLIVVSPFEAFASGHLSDIPTIVGMNNAESNTVFLYFPDIVSPKLMESLNNIPETIIPTLLKEFANSTLKSSIKNIIRDFYFKDKHISWKNLPDFLKLLSDGFISIGTYMTVEIIKMNHSPIYVYEFSVEGDLNYFGNKAKQIFNILNNDYITNMKNDSDANKDKDGNMNNQTVAAVNDFQLSGAAHGDELGYLFLVNKHDKMISSDKSEYQIREQMSKMWTNFAKNTDPNSEDVTVKWEKCTEKTPNHLKIGDEMEIVNTNIETKRYLFWKALFISVFQGNPNVILDYVNDKSIVNN
ncbi:juvenile hormone esterase-like isoform X2 [Lycorma delicatula]|uniref:juvenile hormone esterase-like isoform X2 n=1 Tax=Lycorma delicatula TaxID=130591 RepID=UPI003F51A379